MPLEAQRFVAPIDDPGHPGAYQLGRPAERVAITDLLEALRGPREPAVGCADVSAAVEALLGEFREGEAKAAAGRTLADVLEGLSPLRPSGER